MALSRSVGGSAAVGLGKGATDDQFSLRFQTLHDFLTETVWDDGKPRKPGNFLLFTDGGRWKACVHDKDARTAAFVTADSVDGLLRALEDGLSEGTLDWRKDTR
jgi:hypothetical protein